MNAKGSLKETALRTLLEGAQSERATGTLTVRNDGQSYTLYFLFGHLFHANGEGAVGDEAVVNALRCHDGEFFFDAKAKLPADETVKSSIPELVSTAGENGTGPSGATAPLAPPATPVPEAAAAAPVEPAGQSAGQATEQAAQPQGDPSAPAAGRSEEPADGGPRLGVKHRPQPRNGREPIPVPAGEVVYDSLKTSFVDFPRLITTLENEGYTGYVRLLTEHASGLILFREGVAQECVFDPGEGFSRGRDALMAFNNEVTAGNGVLDVVGLPVAIVDGLYDLVVARPVYTELFASWVDMPSLLEYLAGQGLTGSVMVRSAAGTGIIILTKGKPTGAYTSESRSIDNDPKVVLDLCSDPKAMIEVKAADDTAGRPPLDVDEVVGSRGRSGRPATSVAPPPPPPPPAPAPAPANLPSTATAAPGSGPTSVADTRTMPAFEATPGGSSAPGSPAPSPGETHAGPESADAPPAPPPAGRDNVDWEAVIEELQAMADSALGARSRKVKDLLGSAERNQAGVEGAVAQVSQISLLFVDSALLVKLEQDMRAQLQTHL